MVVLHAKVMNLTFVNSMDTLISLCVTAMPILMFFESFLFIFVTESNVLGIRRRQQLLSEWFSLSFSGHVEIVGMKVTVCRDAVKGKCIRPLCKYYHIPIPLPPANEMVSGQASSAEGVRRTPGPVRTTLDTQLIGAVPGTFFPVFGANPISMSQVGI